MDNPLRLEIANHALTAVLRMETRDKVWKLCELCLRSCVTVEHTMRPCCSNGTIPTIHNC